MNDIKNAIIIFLCIHFACGIIAYGLSYAYFSRKWPKLPEYRRDNLYHVPFGFIALIGLLGCLYKENGLKGIFKYGFKL